MRAAGLTSLLFLKMFHSSSEFAIVIFRDFEYPKDMYSSLILMGTFYLLTRWCHALVKIPQDHSTIPILPKLLFSDIYVSI